MRGDRSGSPWIGPSWRSLAHWATTAARASMCFSTRGANAARTPVGTRLLVVAGTGPDLPHWKRRVAESGETAISVCSDSPRAFPTVLAAADALVSPTRFEPYGMGVHEAICCGLPAFVTRCAGVAERFPAQLDGLLLDDPPDAAQLCERLLVGTMGSSLTGR